MAEEDDQKQKEGEPSEGTQKTEDKNKQPGPIPYDRFQEIVSEKNSLTKQVDELSKAMQKLKDVEDDRRKPELKENEEFETLAKDWEAKYDELKGEHDPTKELLGKHKEVLEGYATQQLETVPEMFREVVSQLPLLERLKWLVDNADKIKEQNKSAAIPQTPAGKGKGDLSDSDRRKRAAKTF